MARRGWRGVALRHSIGCVLLVAASCGYPRPELASDAPTELASDAPTNGPPVYVKASNTQSHDGFGTSVALSADGSTLAVGAWREDNAPPGMNGKGAVYVFTRAGATWTQQAYVKASNAGPDDEFGASVALSADGSTLAVSAPGESSAFSSNPDDNTSFHSGAVYVFTRAAVTWTQQAYLKASVIGVDDQFGSSLALAADGRTLAIGAWNDDGAATSVDGKDNSSPNSGAVYVFTRPDEAWSQQAYVKASNSSDFINFGKSVALAADGRTLAVGAWYENSGATGVNGNQDNTARSHSGAVYVFTRAGAMWSQQAYVKASNTGVNDQFGSSVALAADGSTLAVGAQLEDSAATGVGGNQTNDSAVKSGAVYVFTRAGVIWAQQSYVKASNTGEGDQFGSSVALATDGSTLAVGTQLEDSAATGVGGNQTDDSAADSGAVYVFTRSGVTWVQEAYVKASNTGAGDQFGISVALSADGSTRAIGAHQEDSAATGVDGGNQTDNPAAADSGAVYVFER